MKILVATGNQNKLREIGEILDVGGVDLIGLDSVVDAPEVVEDGDTFEANAVKKASTLARMTGMWTIADDSGLEVDSLDLEPGVRSARYAGEPSDDCANNRKLLASLQGAESRTARFRCVIAISDPEGNSMTVAGKCEGVIVEQPRGDKGFGYDPLFVPDGYKETFGEMDRKEKNRISHRAAALSLARLEIERLVTAL